MDIKALSNKDEFPLCLLLTADPSETLVMEYIKRGICNVAKEQDQIVGVYVLLPTRPETIELVNIAVEERKQGMGIGKKLVLHAIETAKDLGYKTIEVGTGNSSINQLALYQKCGFRITYVDKDFFLRHYQEPIFENGIPCVDMIRLMMDIKSITEKDKN
ncbi:GNAT family N-acetyltransferase [Bacillus sp. B1-b2]|uniref:GNAT family N-acetyltransferase n=1 Tax=Bacillus sp. B1-b2 TaxID=2653201 RepID=UPI001262A85D|nr:GNAT family N-acetyltransferase [Bacillus sp. B1-b2]KAB7672687.1 GNAT family N-acetyltransferase [Bacillus sp. B1-b2]